ncbi:histidine kinase [Streptomyces sp. DSM 41982]|uniref:histidine kinase n=1 Tax=Streptomyces evansiae TaxID=3075535 RepID=A0ABD5E7V4_9ACTN|nr:histidine kinase [Streptomyces sp. DSM 41982]MDT0417438.1 histidine kinase [Streptomyces sp. DSM 41982]
MNETSASASGREPLASGLATERRIAEFVTRVMREDLIADAFAFRPLPVREVPERGARWAWTRWLPQAVVVFAALVCFAVSATGPYGIVLGPVAGFLVLLAMFRPIGAWWLSLPLCLLPAVLDYSVEAFAAAFVVLVVGAWQARPRTAASMWLVSAFLAFGLNGALNGGNEGNIGAYLFLSALALLVSASLRGWRQARQQVAVKEAEVAEKAAEVARKEEVTLVERSRRTLLEERTTIARELHDVVAHHMSVVAIQAEAAPYRVIDPPPELVAAFSTIRENAVVALTELRRVLGVVRAEDAELPHTPQPSLADLDALLDNVRGAGLEVTKRVTGRVRELPQGVELSAYRIVQEALSNTLRHAPGAEAVVELSYVLGGFGLRVFNWAPPVPWDEEDAWVEEGGPWDGEALWEGPAPAPTPSPAVAAPADRGSGHGLTGMRERVAMLEGELTAGPTESGGFEVSVWIPVPVTEPEAERVPEAERGAGRTSERGPGAGRGAEPGAAGPAGTQSPPPPPAAGTAPPPATGGAGPRRPAATTMSFRKDSAPKEGSG